MRHRYTKGIPKLKENPYAPFDSSISPKWLLHQLYGEPISNTSDERIYGNGALRLLESKAVLIEAYREIEKEMKRKDDEDAEMFYPAAYSRGNTLYLYRDNVISVKRNSDDTTVLDFYYPVSRSCVLPDFAKFLVKEKGDSRVSILTMRNGALVAQKVSFPAPVISDLELNYGTGFNKTHAKIVEKLEARNGKIFLFSGHMGSGKSTYIKYLTSVVDREALWIPVNMVGNLASPDFISLLMGKKECILILEDAEQAIQQRGSGAEDSAIATLLNLSDGVLGSLLNVSIIITLNANRSTLDRAIFRKGRLAYDWDFSHLSVEDSNRLLVHLNKGQKTDKPLTLAEIYGVDDDTGHDERMAQVKQMGFHTLIDNK